MMHSSRMRTQTDRISQEGDRLLNRELSWLDFNARVLELAADASVPLLERVKFCSIFSSNLDEFFMVRVAGPVGPGGGRDRACARRTAARRSPTLAEIRERVLELTARQSTLWSRELVPALGEAGIVIAQVDDCSEKELDELERRFDREIYPVLTPLAVGPGQPFPYISGLSNSLAVLRPRPRDGRGALRAREGARGPAALPRGRQAERVRPARERDRALPRLALPADGDRASAPSSASRATPTSRSRTKPTTCSRRSSSSSGAGASATSSGSRSPARSRAGCSRGCTEGLGVGDEQVYPIRGLLDLADLSQLAALDRPDLKDEPWVPRTPARRRRRRGGEDFFSEIRARRHARPPSVRLLRRRPSSASSAARLADPDGHRR